MKFGDKLRQLRNEKGLTQPELAQAMGIEQSYLSKLENDKSMPSNDVLNRILDVFNVEIGDLINGLDQGTRNQMRQIPDVSDHLRLQKQQLIGNRKRWLFVSALLLSFGVAFIYAGHERLFFSDSIYQYKSHGIVLEGESKEIFLNPQRVIPESFDREARDEFTDAIRTRVDEQYLQRSEHHGNIYNVKVPGGSRTYYLEAKSEFNPWQNKMIVFIGVLMTIFGLVGIVLEAKLSRYQ